MPLPSIPSELFPLQLGLPPPPSFYFFYHCSPRLSSFTALFLVLKAKIYGSSNVLLESWAPKRLGSSRLTNQIRS
jgi:hypothetical protein